MLCSKLTEMNCEFHMNAINAWTYGAMHVDKAAQIT